MQQTKKQPVATEPEEAVPFGSPDLEPPKPGGKLPIYYINNLKGTFKNLDADIQDEVKYIEIKASNGLKQIVNQGKSVSEIYKTGYSDAILDGFCNPYVSEAAEELADVEEMFDKLCAK